MPKLILMQRAEVIRELPLKNTKAAYSIGSDEENDLVIDDRYVSNRHALIERHGTQFFVRDLHSAFGTFINGKRVDVQAELHDGDRMRIGEHIVVFENPLEQNGSAGNSEEIVEPVMETVAAAGSAGASPASSTQPRQADPVSEAKPAADKAGREVEMAPYYLLAIYGPYRGKRFQLKYGETRIGRDSKLNDIVIRQNQRGEVDPSISRRHATIAYHDQGFYVLDKRSKTRTYVNQQEVPEDGEIALHPGDEIEIVSDQKSTIFRFVAEGNWDFSPPRKTGLWHVRYRQKLIYAGAALAVLLGFWLAIGGFSDRRILQQRPEPFALQLSKWRLAPGSHAAPMEGGAAARSNYQPPHAAVADFTGDGYVDIAAVGPEQYLRLVDGRNRRLGWKVDAFLTHAGYELTVAPINNDEHPDILLVTKNGRVIGIDGKFGAEIFASEYFTLPFSGPPVAADFDGNGWNDVAIAEANGTLHIGFNRLLHFEWQASKLEFGLTAPLSAADLNGDGTAELIAATDRGLLLLIDAADLKVIGTIDINQELGKAMGAVLTDSQIRFPVSAADLDNDGALELVCTTAQGNLLVLGGTDFKRRWSARLLEEIILNPDFAFPFALADVNADGKLDVVVGLDDGRIKAITRRERSSEAEDLWVYRPKGNAAGARFLAVADLNKDRTPDVVVLDQNRNLRIIDGSSGKALWDTGQPVSEVVSSPRIADFGADTRLDILMLSEQSKVFQYQSNSRVLESMVLWGQQFATPELNQLTTVRLPEAGGATMRMVIGLVLLVLAGVTLWLYRYSYRKFQAA